MTENAEQLPARSADTDTPGLMTAVTQDRYGNADVLTVRRVPVPEPSPDQVLIHVAASSLNMYDVHMTTGYPLLARLSAGLTRPKNMIPGSDLAGTVVRVGSNITDFKPGDIVFGAIGSGAFASFSTARETSIALAPDGVSLEDAAATPLAGTTALQGLRDVGGLRAGQRVVVNGASGGVGTFAVQIAKALGAEVAAVCSTDKVEMVTSLGADRVIDYRSSDYTERLRGYDLLFDNAGNRPWSETAPVLEPGGTQVSITGPKHRLVGPMRLFMWRKTASRFGNRQFTWFTARLRRGDLESLAELLSSGQIDPVIERAYTLDQVPDGLRYLSDGHALGKLVVTS